MVNYGFAKLLLLTGLCLFFVVLLQPHSSHAQDTRLAVIANEQGPPDKLDMKKVKKLFRGEQQRWQEGKKVKIALMKDAHPTGNHTASKLYNMSGNELKKYWLSLVFQGTTSAPEFFNSEESLVNYVKTTSGAIGIVSVDAAKDANTILVEGEPYF